MRIFSVGLFALFCLVSWTQADSPFTPNEDQIKANWNVFKSNHGMYKLSSMEENMRFKLFKDNYLKVVEHNQEADENKVDYRTNINRFSALTKDEYRRKLGIRSFKKSNATQESARLALESNGIHLKDASDLPESVSYYSKMNPVKNQFSCGGCWAFATAGVVEGLYAMKENTLRRFSEQQLIDCTADTTYDNFACNGGYPSRAFQYVKNVGLVEEGYYPYRAAQTKCFDNNGKQKYKVRGSGDVPFGNEAFLKKIVGTIGPVAIALDASNWGFIHYSSGIYSDPACSQTKVNHAVMIVGYGVENGKEYWLVRNSWGTQWGIGGYMKLARNKNNMCGVASLASYAYL